MKTGTIFTIDAFFFLNNPSPFFYFFERARPEFKILNPFICVFVAFSVKINRPSVACLELYKIAFKV